MVMALRLLRWDRSHTAPWRTPVVRLLTGMHINGLYVLQEQLGNGFFATVFKATTVRAGWDDASVAIKFFQPERDRSDFLERFRREMRFIQDIAHPHIIRWLDSGLYEEVPYIVLELATGGSLRTWKPEHERYAVPEACWIIYQALSGLRAAGTIHRDLKPDNLLIMLGDARTAGSFIIGDPVQGHCIKVADWGLARDHQLPAGGARLTRTQDVAGTPWYMSPEQCFGTRHAGHASDMYALACVLYEFLCGEPPFAGTTAEEVLHRQVYGQVTFPPELPMDVIGVLAKALEKESTKRYASIGAFQRALVPLMGLPGDWTYSHDAASDVADDPQRASIQPIDI